MSRVVAPLAMRDAERDSIRQTKATLHRAVATAQQAVDLDRAGEFVLAADAYRTAAGLVDHVLWHCPPRQSQERQTLLGIRTSYEQRCARLERLVRTLARPPSATKNVGRSLPDVEVVLVEEEQGLRTLGQNNPTLPSSPAQRNDARSTCRRPPSAPADNQMRSFHPPLPPSPSRPASMVGTSTPETPPSSRRSDALTQYGRQASQARRHPAWGPDPSAPNLTLSSPRALQHHHPSAAGSMNSLPNATTTNPVDDDSNGNTSGEAGGEASGAQNENTSYPSFTDARLTSPAAHEARQSRGASACTTSNRGGTPPSSGPALLPLPLQHIPTSTITPSSRLLTPNTSRQRTPNSSHRQPMDDPMDLDLAGIEPGTLTLLLSKPLPELPSSRSPYDTSPHLPDTLQHTSPSTLSAAKSSQEHWTKRAPQVLDMLTASLPPTWEPALANPRSKCKAQPTMPPPLVLSSPSPHAPSASHALYVARTLSQCIGCSIPTLPANPDLALPLTAWTLPLTNPSATLARTTLKKLDCAASALSSLPQTTWISSRPLALPHANPSRR